MTQAKTKPPTPPVIVYDGSCGFCRRWVARWQALTGDRVEYVASEDVPDRLADAVREHVGSAVVLIGPKGEVHVGAAAVFNVLAYAPGHGWKLWIYDRVPGAAPVAEWFYRFVARHRHGFSALAHLLWGRDPAPSTFDLARWIYLRLLGAVFLIAFVSLWTQVHGLVGSNGILPVADLIELAGQRFGVDRYWKLPTLCWIDSSDAFLAGLCVVGTLLAVLLVVGVAPIPVLALLWATYLSLVVAGQVFLSFQWDMLLLEAGFLAMFLAPAEIRPRLRSRDPPSRAGLFLHRWLLFKLMFLSGVTKLLSGDPTWRDLTALNVHYETQPLPSWIGYYAHQLPDWFQKTSVIGMYVGEIGLPLLIFGPRRLRHAAGIGLIAVQLLIATTGSYCFFNLLSISLCVLLFDDRLLYGLLPRRLAAPRAPTSGQHRPGRLRRAVVVTGAVLIMLTSILAFLREMAHTQRRDTLPGVVVWTLDSCQRYVLIWGRHVLRVTDPFRTISGYGLFRVMTTQRPEIVIDGSNDRINWIAYEFKWKPGDPQRRPRYAAPHQPRLDWQMWFAALNPPGNAHWLERLIERLLQGSPDVLDLFESNPFPDGPPRSIQLMYYQYRFTDLETKRETGAWWRRELVGPLTPPMSLPEARRADNSPR